MLPPHAQQTNSPAAFDACRAEGTEDPIGREASATPPSASPYRMYAFPRVQQNNAEVQVM